MSGVLVVAESRRGELREVSLELVSAAVAVAGEMGGSGGSVSVAVLGEDAPSFASGLGAEGVGEVLTVATPGGFEAEVWGAAVEALIDECSPSLVLCGHTIDSMGFAPAVAARRGLGFASDAIGVGWSDGLRVRRGAFGDKLVAELEFPGEELLDRDGAVRDLSRGGGRFGVRAGASGSGRVGWCRADRACLLSGGGRR